MSTPAACGHKTILRSGCRVGTVQCVRPPGHQGPHRNASGVEWENEMAAGEPELQAWLRQQGLAICRLRYGSSGGGGGSPSGSTTAGSSTGGSAGGGAAYATSSLDPSYRPLGPDEYRALQQQLIHVDGTWAPEPG